MRFVRSYSRYLHRKAAEDPENIYPRVNWYVLPWLFVMFLFVPIDAVFSLSGPARVWTALATCLAGALGMAFVTLIFIRENMAAARRQAPRYGESRFID